MSILRPFPDGNIWVKEYVNQSGVNAVFTSHEMDVETKFFYAKARYYDAQLGRFISVDDRIDGLFTHKGLNVYSYCHHNSVRFIDPSGHSMMFGDIVPDRSSSDSSSADNPTTNTTNTTGSGETSSSGYSRIEYDHQKETSSPPPKWPLSTPKRNTYSGASNRGRSFGAGRGNGRTHAGTDLLAPHNTPVRAMKDGVVLYHGPFYLGTNQLHVNHGSYIARYGEIGNLAEGVTIGSRVRRGQVITHVRRFQPSPQSNPNRWYSMLHLEMYKNTELNTIEFPLTNRSSETIYENVPQSNYQRRRDLMDPTLILDIMEE